MSTIASTLSPHVEVSASEYKALCMAKAKLDVIENAYRNGESFSMSYVLSAVFGKKEGDSNAE